MVGKPAAIFIVDTKKEHLALKEAQKTNIPIVGVVDTNTNPYEVDYPIPANDDAIRAVKLCVEKIANACQEGRHIFMQKVQSGELTAEKVEESDYVVERKAFVFKSNTQDPEQDSVVYAEDENQEKQDS